MFSFFKSATAVSYLFLLTISLSHSLPRSLRCTLNCFLHTSDTSLMILFALFWEFFYSLCFSSFILHFLKQLIFLNKKKKITGQILSFLISCLFFLLYRFQLIHHFYKLPTQIKTTNQLFAIVLERKMPSNNTSNSVQNLYAELKGAWQKKPPNLKNCGVLLEKLKVRSTPATISYKIVRN